MRTTSSDDASWNRVLRCTKSAMLLSAYVFLFQTLHILARNRFYFSDLGGWTYALVAAYVGYALIGGLLFGCLTSSVLVQNLCLAASHYLVISLQIMLVRARIITNPTVAVVFLVGTGLAILAAYQLIVRARVNETFPHLLIVVYLNACCFIAADWKVRGGRLSTFLASPKTLAVVAAGIGIVLVAAFLMKRLSNAHVRLFHGGILAACGLAILLMMPGAGISRRAGALAGPNPDVYVVSFDAMRKDVFDQHCRTSNGVLARICREGIHFENLVSDGLATYEILERNTFGGEARASAGHQNDCAGTLPAMLQQKGYHTSMYLGRAGFRIAGADCYDRYFSGSGWLLARGYGLVALFREGAGSTGEATGIRSRFISSPDILHVLEADSRAIPGALFAYLHVLDLHAPLVPAAKASDSDYIAAVTTYMEKCYATACPVSANASLIQRMKNGYVSAYIDLDAVMKELLSVAAKRNRRFILAITADHGELFGEHGGFAHSGGFVPELLSIPAVVFDSQRSYGGRTVCTPMLSSELLSRVAESAMAGKVDGLLKEMDRPVVRVQARDLGAAEIDTRAGALRFHVKESMRAQRGTWHNIHTTEQGTVPFPMAQCRPRTDRADAR